jgi:hypothetical protein
MPDLEGDVQCCVVHATLCVVIVHVHVVLLYLHMYTHMYVAV